MGQNTRNSDEWKQLLINKMKCPFLPFPLPNTASFVGRSNRTGSSMEIDKGRGLGGCVLSQPANLLHALPSSHPHHPCLGAPAEPWPSQNLLWFPSVKVAPHSSRVSCYFINRNSIHTYFQLQHLLSLGLLKRHRALTTVLGPAA